MIILKVLYKHKKINKSMEQILCALIIVIQEVKLQLIHVIGCQDENLLMDFNELYLYYYTLINKIIDIIMKY